MFDFSMFSQLGKLIYVQNSQNKKTRDVRIFWKYTMTKLNKIESQFFAAL